MTPSLIRTQQLGTSFNADALVERRPHGAVSLRLGWEVEFVGNRREDFENLIAAATRALALFDNQE